MAGLIFSVAALVIGGLFHWFGWKVPGLSYTIDLLMKIVGRFPMKKRKSDARLPRVKVEVRGGDIKIEINQRF
jgi:hypothetical protein